MNPKKKKNIIHLLWIIPVAIIILHIFYCLVSQALTFNWNETTGEVTWSHTYIYSVNGIEYENHTIEYKPGGFGNQLVDDKSLYPVGSKVKVYYNPAFPEKSVLKKGSNIIMIIGWLSPVVLFAFILIVIRLSFIGTKKLNLVLKNMGFRIENGSFGQYNIAVASDDFSLFHLRSMSTGDASFVRWKRAGIEIDGRFIELTRIIDYDRIKQVIEFRFETAWQFYLHTRNKHMVGKTYNNIKTLSEKIKLDELNIIYIRKQKNLVSADEKRKYHEGTSYDSRREFISFARFDTEIKNFDDFFKTRFGSLRVREALKGIHTIGITESLDKWKRMIYDIIIEDTIRIRINPAKISTFPFTYLLTFSKIIPQLLEDLIVFVGKLENCLMSYTPKYEGFQKEYKCVSIKASIHCKKCKTVLPLNGLIPFLICHKCGTKNNLSNDQWEIIVYDPYKYYESGKIKWDADEREGWNFGHLEWNAENPRCCHCGTPFHESQIKNHSFNKTTYFECPNCKGTNTASPPPDWALELSPFMVLIYNAEQENNNSGKIKPWSIKYWFLGNKNHSEFDSFNHKIK